MPLTVIFVVLFSVSLFVKKWHNIHISVFFAVAIAAFLLRTFYLHTIVFPSQNLIGTSQTVKAIVCDTVPSYEDNVGATLLVKEISGAEIPFPFKVNVISMQRVKSG
ncbi:MAG: hypothetical protein RSC01_04895, partial [Oscillospiraceae bacterium]